MLFYLQLAVSFLVGALFIALQTLIAERVTERWRGIVLTVPSTMAVGFFFIGLTKTAADVTVVARIVPLVFVAAYTFTVIFALLIRYGVLLSTLCSIIGFGAVSFMILTFPPPTFLISILCSAPFIAIAYIIVSSLQQARDLKPCPMNVGRGLIGGTLALMTVLLSKTLGNIWGGIFSAFPASFSSTLLIYTHFQGAHVIPAIVKSLFFPGVIVLNLYAFIATITFPIWGIWIGTLVSYIVCFLLLWGYIAFTDRTVKIAS